MKYFLSFMGYPRSGHTLIAAILNANPNVICSNQLNIFDSNNIDLDYIKSYSMNTGTWKKSTQIAHVPKEEIKVIGDKTGHRTLVVLKNEPRKLGIVKSQVNVPIKWIHVVRNPYDNLATWALLNYQNKMKKGNKITQKATLDDVIQKYRELNQTIDKLKKSEDVLTVNHEYIITRMHNTLEEMANFLEISFDPIWRDNVRNAVWKKPRITRNKIKWTPQQKASVDNIIQQYSWLDGYVFGGCGGCGRG